MSQEKKMSQDTREYSAFGSIKICLVCGSFEHSFEEFKHGKTRKKACQQDRLQDCEQTKKQPCEISS